MPSIIWPKYGGTRHGRRKGLACDIVTLDKKMDTLLNRLVETHSPSTADAIEGHLAKLEVRKCELNEALRTIGRPARSFEDTVRTAPSFIATPWKLWASERFEDKRTVLKLAFTRPLAYVRNEGFRTAEMAPRRGFEPLTLRLGI